LDSYLSCILFEFGEYRRIFFLFLNLYKAGKGSYGFSQPERSWEDVFSVFKTPIFFILLFLFLWKPLNKKGRRADLRFLSCLLFS